MPTLSDQDLFAPSQYPALGPGRPAKVTTYQCACVHTTSLVAGIQAAPSCPTHGDPIVKDEQGARSAIASVPQEVAPGYTTRDELVALLG